MPKVYATINELFYEMLLKELDRNNVPKEVWWYILDKWSDSAIRRVQGSGKPYKPRQVVIDVNNDIYDKFMLAVRLMFGDKKGSVSKAVETALKEWLFER